MVWARRGLAERCAAAASGFSIWINELKSALVEAVKIINRDALDETKRVFVDKDFQLLHLKNFIIVQWILFK